MQNSVKNISPTMLRRDGENYFILHNGKTPPLPGSPIWTGGYYKDGQKKIKIVLSVIETRLSTGDHDGNLYVSFVKLGDNV